MLICKREEEVALLMAQHEEEAVRRIEEQLSDARIRREAEIKKEVDESLTTVEEKMQWVMNRENDLVAEETHLNKDLKKRWGR